ncbi:MAG: aminoglycoside phosphotransferase family protein [Deltaproteobacteria bacterium]|nr:aminoglycoside phosphotransferase family protein [Deltaproteobacteria bacterium]
MNVVVSDTYGVGKDPALSFLSDAIDPAIAGSRLRECLRAARGWDPELLGIRVARLKPGRRAVVEYDIRIGGERSASEKITLLGKARAKGIRQESIRVQLDLRNAGFGSGSEDAVFVPEPVGVIPEFRMWLQRKVPGVSAARLLPGADGPALADRIAGAIHKVHRAGVPAHRRHTMGDELAILKGCLERVAEMRPAWKARLQRLLSSCGRIGAAVPGPEAKGIHRDFHPDQVIVDGERLFLVDFDDYCEGDPGVDAGNFTAHLTELALRTMGDPDALRDREETFRDRFFRLSGARHREAADAYALLTLARHIHISTLFPDRRLFTERILDLCELRAAGEKAA